MAGTNTNMTVATPRDYWISPNALHIERNAMSNPDYIQASCVSGAQILVYIKDVISYDAGHNYRRWVLQASPTVFNTHTEKYVYVGIPRNDAQNVATVVFPSEKLDIYGKNEKEEQIGSENYYYIFLQGILSSSGDNGTEPRDWLLGHTIHTGYLSSDEAINAGPNESEWFQYRSADNIVTFLKDLTMAADTKFRKLFAKAVTIVSGGYITFEGQSGSLKGIANEDTPVDSEETIVTPKYVDDNALSKNHDDSTEHALTVGSLTSDGKLTVRGDTQLRGDTFFGTGSDKTSMPHVDGGSGDALLGDVVLTALQSKDFDALLQRGFGFTKGVNGKFTLSVTDLMVWGKAVFNELEIRKLSSVGGNVYLSGASSKIAHVKEEMQDGQLVGWRCYILADDGTTATQNGWKMYDQARCQTFNISAGSYEGVGNRNYWRLVTGVSSTNETITDDEGNDLYNGKKFAWVVLSATDCEDRQTNDVPAAGDAIVLDGHRQFAEDDARAVYNDTARTNVMMLQTTGNEGSVPNIISLQGIVDYRHSASNNKYSNTVFILSPEEVVFLSSRFKWISASGAPITLVNFRGAWKQGETYYYYDQVSHNNAIWTCIVAEGSSTTEEPTDTSTVWRKDLTGGVPGEPGADGLAYILQVTSDKGTVLVNGAGSLLLTGTLYRNGEDVTSTIAEGNWSWYRVSADTADDAVWNRLHEGVGNTCSITGEDVSRVAQFGCRAYVQDTSSAKVLTIDSLEQ